MICASWNAEANEVRIHLALASQPRTSQRAVFPHSAAEGRVRRDGIVTIEKLSASGRAGSQIKMVCGACSKLARSRAIDKTRALRG